MISSVIFDSFCLDMCLSFGCSLDVVMLQLLGDSLVMCGPNSDVGIDYQLSAHGSGLFWCYPASRFYSASYAILGHTPYLL